ncbi:MAG: hypothetical protein JKY57_03905 [Kordiimonadaceae bacterium]|nr:hypothetical protein [Kordiimonadaceae bacterium]
MAECVGKTLGSNKLRNLKPSAAQIRYLTRGIAEPGGKLPLFDDTGQRIKDQTIRACITKGWCKPWYNNPIQPKWLVCKLTKQGRVAVKRAPYG